LKASEWLREYEVSGAVPDGEGDKVLAFWCGWLIGPGHTALELTKAESISMAIKAAEFIERQR
jgi:hypothetical protein